MYNKTLQRNSLLFVLLVFSQCFVSCGSKNKNTKPGFVTLEGKTFKLDGKDFYPIVLNYGVDLMAGNNVFWVSPSTTGFETQKLEHNKDATRLRFKADMQLIKDMGFNAVRLVGIAEYQIKNNAITKNADCGKDSLVELSGETLTKYMNGLDDMFKVLNEVGLKAIVLTKKLPDTNELVDAYLSKMLARFKEEKAILAWDFFNEPLYFDPTERKKEEVYKIVQGWKKFSRMYAPNQLLTMGLTGTREVFEWDPNILDVDFLSIHPYEFHKGEVENELYWYWKYVNKTWIIGETGYSADNDSVSYDLQKDYAIKFLKRAVNCNASGFSWWQYKDYQWYDFQSNYLGLVNNSGTTATSDKNLTVTGTVKPAGKVFKDFDVHTRTEDCTCRDNYYNYDGLSQYAVKGKLINESTGAPIEGGGIVAWEQWFGKSNLTFSKADGSFKVFGDYKLYHTITSATRMNSLRQEFDWDKVQLVNEDGVPTYDLGTIKLRPLNLPK